jgi:hypothetical protein
MLIQIFSHTPVYVWAILAFLVYRGVAMRRDREAGMRLLAVMPLVMLGLSLQGVIGNFGVRALPLAVWLTGLVLGVAASWSLVNGERIATAPGSDGQKVIQRGSWWPLALMMAIFVAKYVLAVAMVMMPSLATDRLFVAGACALFGLLSGLFLGRSARYLAACWVAMRAVTSMPMPR